MKKLMILFTLLSIIQLSLIPACKNEQGPDPSEEAEQPKTPLTLDLSKYTWRDFIPEENLGNYSSDDDNMTAYMHNCISAILQIEAEFGIEYNEKKDYYWYPRSLKADGTDTDEEIRATLKKLYIQLEKAEVWAKKFRVIFDKVKKKDGVFAPSLINPTYRVCKNLPSRRVIVRYNPGDKILEKEYFELNQNYLDTHFKNVDEIRWNFKFGFDVHSYESLDYIEYELNRAKGAPYTEFKGVR